MKDYINAIDLTTNTFGIVNVALGSVEQTKILDKDLPMDDLAQAIIDAKDQELPLFAIVDPKDRGTPDINIYFENNHYRSAHYLEDITAKTLGVARYGPPKEHSLVGYVDISLHHDVPRVTTRIINDFKLQPYDPKFELGDKHIRSKVAAVSSLASRSLSQYPDTSGKSKWPNQQAMQEHSDSHETGSLSEDILELLLNVHNAYNPLKYIAFSTPQTDKWEKATKLVTDFTRDRDSENYPFTVVHDTDSYSALKGCAEVYRQHK